MAPVADVADLVAGLDNVLRCRDEARIWSRAGRRMIEENYTDDILVEKTLALYERLIAGRARRRP